MRRRIKKLLRASPGMFAAVRSAELYANALLRRVHDEEYRAVAAFADPRVIADVGANLGQSIASFARIFPAARYRAFEPSPACQGALRIVARLARARVEVHACGLGSEATRLPFYVPVVAGTALLQEGSFDPNMFRQAVTLERIGADFRLDVLEVPVRRLDDFPDRYDLIKVDAQGFELAVLQGARETLDRHRPLVFVENGPETPAVEAFLEGFGYRNATPAALTLNSLFLWRGEAARP